MSNDYHLQSINSQHTEKQVLSWGHPSITIKHTHTTVAIIILFVFYLLLEFLKHFLTLFFTGSDDSVLTSHFLGKNGPFLMCRFQSGPLFTLHPAILFFLILVTAVLVNGAYVAAIYSYRILIVNVLFVLKCALLVVCTMFCHMFLLQHNSHP